MDIESIRTDLGTIVRAATHLSGIAAGEQSASESEIGTLNLSMGMATGRIAQHFLLFEAKTIDEGALLEAARALPTPLARSVLNLAVQMAAHVYFAREMIDGAHEIPEFDEARDRPADKVRELAPLLDPDTLELKPQ